VESKKENLSRDFCLGLVNDLETIKRWELKNSPLAIALADFIFGHRRDIRNYVLDLEPLNDLVERLAPVFQTENAMSLPELQGEGTLPSSGFLTSDILLNSDFLADRILPWVQLVRTELFGSVDAPFSSNKDAENWIQEQAKNGVYGVGGGSPWPGRDMREQLVHDILSVSGVSEVFPLGRTLEYLGEDGKVHQIKIKGRELEDWEISQFREEYDKWTMHSLSWLENETRIMARATGFTKPSLVQFILMGIRPVLPRYLVKGKVGYQATPTGDILQPFHLEIEIRARDLGFEELRRIYQTYRHTQPRKAKALSGVHWAIYRLVKERGGPVSGKGSVQFWKSVMEQWNTLHSEKRYSHWKGIKIAYERIIERLEIRQQLRNSQEVQERRQK